MKNRSLIESFNNAINGIISTFRSERNMKIHIIAAVLVLGLSLFYDLTRIEFIIVCITIALVIICELFNTAIEVLIDTLIGIYHPRAKTVKDTAAGAVLVSAVLSLAVAYFIFFDRVSTSLESGIARIKQAPMHLTVIAIVVTIAAVLVLKIVFRKGTPFSGGMPSGHSAIAFSAATAVALYTNNTTITILFIIVALLVVQSRLEGKIHNMPELLAGAVIGFLVTLLLFQVLS
ncbi:MAG TPA: diacylglycerol kinase [Clostridiales bacterium]|nr:diacylglycerol kinase [Clostridiales bacterium]HPV01563.1 diacylglycerol kinase [Clostridiales bacterium]